jgi:hypothetical protein
MAWHHLANGGASETLNLGSGVAETDSTSCTDRKEALIGDAMRGRPGI